MAFDFKKEYKDLYLPKDAPMKINVPPMQFIMIDGIGDPNDRLYQDAVGALYTVAYTIKMSKKWPPSPTDYFDFVVPPLEGLWHIPDDALFDPENRGDWQWTAMIRMPDFVTEQVFAGARTKCKEKKPEIDLGSVRLAPFHEGLCVQIMHIGPYREESISIEKLHRFMAENNLTNMTSNTRKHHEIYLNDPRKTAPDRLKTIIRLPVM